MGGRAVSAPVAWVTPLSCGTGWAARRTTSSWTCTLTGRTGPRRINARIPKPAAAVRPTPAAKPANV